MVFPVVGKILASTTYDSETMEGRKVGYHIHYVCKRPAANRVLGR